MKRTISNLTVLTILAMIAGSLSLQGTLLAQRGKSKAGAAIVKGPGGNKPLPEPDHRPPAPHLQRAFQWC